MNDDGEFLLMKSSVCLNSSYSIFNAGHALKFFLIILTCFAF